MCDENLSSAKGRGEESVAIPEPLCPQAKGNFERWQQGGEFRWSHNVSLLLHTKEDDEHPELQECRNGKHNEAIDELTLDE